MLNKLDLELIDLSEQRDSEFWAADEDNLICSPGGVKRWMLSSCTTIGKSIAKIH